jgi:diguanylate cyclase (GGDEF)-like protein
VPGRRIDRDRLQRRTDRDRTARTVGAVLVVQDMSRERQYAARLSNLASHDPLTGLLNRREFEQRVRATVEHREAEEGQHAVLYLDLDQFKVVNDTSGHAAGDELLRQVGALLRPRLREGDVLARLGGDEFGVLLPHCPPSPALRIAEALRKAIVDFRFAWKNRSFTIGVSIGLVNLAEGRIRSRACCRPRTPRATSRRTRAAIACRSIAPRMTKSRCGAARWSG